MITTYEKLTELVERLKKADLVALDTEFVWERTYFPQLGLIQVGVSKEEAWLIDAPAIDDLSPLGDIMADPKIVKILHDAQQDLMIIRRATGASPKNVFDTRQAGGFAGLKASLSLQNLVREMAGVRLPKTETRTDWLRRPLTRNQVDYALNDVRYLPTVYRKLMRKIEKKGRLTWLEQERSLYDNPELYKERDGEFSWRRVKGAGRFSVSEDMILLRNLAAWREDEAMRRDRPRGHVLPDEAIIGLVQRKPENRNALGGIRGVGEKIRERDGAKLLTVIREAVEGTEQWDAPPSDKVVEEDKKGPQVDLALSVLKGVCLAKGIDPALVASRAEIARLVYRNGGNGSSPSPLLHGWREELIGADLGALLSGEIAVRVDTDSGYPALIKTEPHPPTDS